MKKLTVDEITTGLFSLDNSFTPVARLCPSLGYGIRRWAEICSLCFRCRHLDVSGVGDNCLEVQRKGTSDRLTSMPEHCDMVYIWPCGVICPSEIVLTQHEIHET